VTDPNAATPPHGIPSEATPDELDLSVDVVTLTAQLVDIPSESLHEDRIATAVAAALQRVDHLEVSRHGNTVVARTNLGRDERVLIGGHLDTVPSSGNIPHRDSPQDLYGLGACDMKGGVAVALRLASELSAPLRDVTYVFYEGEEIASEHNGLMHLARDRPDMLAADFAILMEPSNAQVEAGCQGTLRVTVSTAGVRAHSARAWMGHNAVHEAVQILQRLDQYQPRVVQVDGLDYREGLNAVGIEGGVAGNVIPDRCVVTVNYRFAPSRTGQEAVAHVRDVFAGFELEVDDLAPGALPGLQLPAARDFLAAVGGQAHPKFGWTDVARFAEIGTPAVNYGPGDPSLAHAADERVPKADLLLCEQRLRAWLTGSEQL
jgi:succinyl-diaminopimelate desuccinylase